MSNQERIEEIRRVYITEQTHCPSLGDSHEDLRFLLAQLTAAKPAIELYEAVREFKKYLANEINWCARNYDGNKGTPEGMFHKGTLKALIAAERKFIALAKQISGEGDNGNS